MMAMKIKLKTKPTTTKAPKPETGLASPASVAKAKKTDKSEKTGPVYPNYVWPLGMAKPRVEQLIAEAQEQFPYGTRVKSLVEADTEGYVVEEELENGEFGPFICPGWAQYNGRSYRAACAKVLWDRSVNLQHVDVVAVATLEVIDGDEFDPSVLEPVEPEVEPETNPEDEPEDDSFEVEIQTDPSPLQEREPVQERKQIQDDGLGLTDHPELAKVLGMPIHFDFKSFQRLVGKLRDLVGLPTGFDAHLQASEVQLYAHDLDVCYSGLKLAYDESRNVYDNWFAEQVDRAWEEAKAKYQESKKLKDQGRGVALKAPEYAVIKSSISGSRLNRMYLSQINKYEYWVKLLERTIKAMDRKAMFIMNLNRTSGGGRNRMDPDMSNYNAPIPEPEDVFGQPLLQDIPTEDVEEAVEEAPAPQEPKKLKLVSEPAKPAVSKTQKANPVPSSLAQVYPWIKDREEELSTSTCSMCNKLVIVDTDGDRLDPDGSPHSSKCVDPSNPFKAPKKDESHISFGDNDFDGDFSVDVESDFENDSNPTEPSKQPNPSPASDGGASDDLADFDFD